MKLTVSEYATYALQFDVSFRLRTGLMLSSGEEGDFADSSVEKTPDGRLHINGHAWASLFRRAMSRLGDHKALAAKIGDYEPDKDYAVSRFWFSPFISDHPLPALDINPGNTISRVYGSAADTALYADEVVPEGLEVRCRFTVFSTGSSDADEVKNAVGATLWVINEGIENIGGGWSYGYGRLALTTSNGGPYNAKFRELDLDNDDSCLRVFDPDSVEGFETLGTIGSPAGTIVKPWKKFTLNAGVLKDQLLAIHTEQEPGGDVLPASLDKYLFRRLVIDGGSVTEQISITGKAIRQALLAVPLERKWRTRLKAGEHFCGERLELCTCPTCIDFRKHKKENEKENSPGCTCKCRLFGSTYRRGMVAVLDAEVAAPVTEALQRIALCEHSMQNINMFSGEYLKGGTFKSEIFVDSMRMQPSDFQTIVAEVEQQLNELSPDSAGPPGWHRLGATSTATGQITATIAREPSHV